MSFTPPRQCDCRPCEVCGACHEQHPPAAPSPQTHEQGTGK